MQNTIANMNVGHSQYVPEKIRFTPKEMAKELGISIATFNRNKKRIQDYPQGRKYSPKVTYYTKDDLELIHQLAEKLGVDSQ